MAMATLLQKDDFDHIFTDVELQELLSKAGDGEQLDMFPGLQFHPPVPSEVAPMAATAPPLPIPPLPSSAVSSFDDLPRTAAQGFQALSLQAMQQSGQSSGQHTAALQLEPALSAQATSGAKLPIALPPPPAFTLGATSGRTKAPAEKPQVSHSTVEKQRRDRINSLIDELRELVPPSKATLAAAAQLGGKDANANSEARRPKHVVLADTIALLKQLQLKAPLATLLNGPPPQAGRPSPPVGSSPRAPGGAAAAAAALVKEEPPANHLSPSNSNSKGSVSSHEDVDMKDDSRTAAPKLPHIPIQPTMLSGVVVERGPDCMYVQVKCRDRKGLLMDIMNALKQLQIEVRTAAVTTTQDGLVRDVFEVCVDDEGLQPADVQNMVHEALFQQYPAAADTHKRVRC